MSLAALIFRQLTVLALTGKTLAGAEVRSSMLAPLNEMADDSAVPVIAVFTDTSKGDVQGGDMIGASVAVTLALEIACFRQAPTKDQNEVETFIPETDEGIEMTLDIIQRQAIAELQIGQTNWASLWRECKLKITALNAERGAAIEKGIKFAARRVEIVCELVSDPIPGAELPAFWGKALDALDAEDRTQGFATLLRAVANGATLPDWKQWQAELGLTDAGMRTTGVAPFAESEADDGSIRPATELAGEDIDRDETIRVVSDAATIQHGDGAPTPLKEPSND